jgi:predicted DNA-binding transcriptional regulator YafY
MLSIYNIYKNIILESVNANQIIDAIDGKYRVNIYYDGDENTAKGKRYIEIYAYGLSKAGNEVIRAFQLFGDTMTEKPQWKMFRLDKISQWNPTSSKYYNPVSDRDNTIHKFNPDGDRSMSRVLKIAKF